MALPNILFILIDDLGWKDLGCYGSTFYETPNLDALAAQSMRFTDAYAACPVCSPTRASILTGKYPATVGITDWIDEAGGTHPCRGRLIDAPYLKEMPTGEVTLAAALKDAGYATWHVGKWHLGGEGHAPQDFGFDVNIGGCAVGSPGAGGYFSPWSIPALTDVDMPSGTYLTDYLTDQAISLIQNHGDKPFFLNMWYYSVHTPIEAKADKIKKYEDKAAALGLDVSEPFEEGDPFPTEHKQHLRIRRRTIQSDPVYAAMIASLDENIGRLLAAIDAAGQAENTIVFFTSDNGGLATSEGSPTCNAPLAEGKGWMYEGGTREPLLVRWPGVTAPGGLCSIPVTSPDFYPTLLDVAGLPLRPDQHIDGITFAPLLRGDDNFDRTSIFWHYPHYGNQGGVPGASVRAGDYKLIEFYEDDRVELYNLRDDIGETNDLAAVETEWATVMGRMVGEWRDSIEAIMPVSNPEWKA